MFYGIEIDDLNVKYMLYWIVEKRQRRSIPNTNSGSEC